MHLKIFLKVLLWLLYLPGHLLIIVNRRWLAWVAIKYFSTDNKLQLKPAFDWFMTIDNPLSGDSGWQLKHIPPGSDPLSDENRRKWMERNGGNKANHYWFGLPADNRFIIQNSWREHTRNLWARPDGAWQFRATVAVPFINKVWTPFIGWGLFGPKEERCKFTFTLFRFNRLERD